ncbi:hypothetical protein L195_g031489 [Trifolium pratense]|uniref:Uncharacterized protein n=1 Tax=Trifolium pratense TaxID=57577 RepID=A0A2K3LAJ1_TRIPR|nr:hypothetical protein L195_g031489 [Trifolium pratense]
MLPDQWCGPPIADQLQIPEFLHASLSAKVKHFILNGHRNAQPFFMISFLTSPLLFKINAFLWKLNLTSWFGIIVLLELSPLKMLTCMSQPRVNISSGLRLCGITLFPLQDLFSYGD